MTTVEIAPTHAPESHPARYAVGYWIGTIGLGLAAIVVFGVVAAAGHPYAGVVLAGAFQIAAWIRASRLRIRLIRQPWLYVAPFVGFGGKIATLALMSTAEGIPGVPSPAWLDPVMFCALGAWASWYIASAVVAVLSARRGF